MTESLQQLISGRGFDKYLDGLEARFRAHQLKYSIVYSGATPNPSLFIRLEGSDRLGDICAWESGHCDTNVVKLGDGQLESKHYTLTSADAFHEQLAALFRFVVKRQFPDDDLGRNPDGLPQTM